MLDEAVELSKRISCQTGDELVMHLLRAPKQTFKLLKPQNGSFDLSCLWSVFTIINREEEARFVKRLHHLQKKVNRK